MPVIDQSLIESIARGIASDQLSSARHAKQKQEQDAEQVIEIRQTKIDEWFSRGGRPALEAIKKFGRNEKGAKLDWTPVVEQSILITADLRFTEVIDTGCSQASKTTAEMLTFLYYVSEGQINCAWFYDTWGNLRRNVPEQFQPMAQYWEELKSSIFKKKKKRFGNSAQNLERYAIGNATAIFSHANSGKSNKDVATGSSGVSFQSNLLYLDESSQYPPGSDFSARLEHSCIPTRPTRRIGTPGAGAGVEQFTLDANHYFYPHIQCPSCGKQTCLDPKGAVLKLHKRIGSVTDEWSYFSPSGRPQVAREGPDGPIPAEWYHSDPNDPVESAFVACQSCYEPIPQEILATESYLACRNTGKTAIEVLESIPAGVPKRPIKAVIHRSPLCRPNRINIAADLIRDGLKLSTDPRDWQQQKLGHPSETAQTKLTMKVISDAIRAKHRHPSGDLILAGCDQGTESNFLWISAVKFPSKWESMIQKDLVDEIIDQTIQTVLFAGMVAGDDIPAKLEEYRVDFGLMDSQPGREHSARIAKATVIELATQIENPNAEAVTTTTIKEGGSDPIDCWRIRNSRFLNAVLNVFYTRHQDGDPLTRLPESWEQYLNEKGSSKKYEATPVTHLLSPWYDTKTNRWQRGSSHVDDYFYACMFSQAALYIWLVHKSGKSSGGTFIHSTSPRPQNRNIFSDNRNRSGRLFG